MKKNLNNLKTLKPKSKGRGVLILLILAFLLVGGVLALRHWYANNLSPVSSSTWIVYFTVSEGETKDQIGEGLKQAHLIRSPKAFSTYLRSNEVQILQAGTYKFSQSLSVQQIVHAMRVGDVAKNLLTILPGKRIDQIKQTFLNAGYSQTDVNTAFDPATYAGMPILTNLPAGASLEGFLYPDSFQKEADTPASTIVKESLEEMQTKLTSELIDGFGAQGLSVFQAVTLASIVEQESGNPTDQPTVAQVFLSRLRQGMMLGSDVTAFYASALAGQTPSVGIESPYNTRIHTGLPPGPIGNVTSSALAAVARPSNTNYLYFVAGDDGTLHFTQNEAQHEQAVQQYCHKACGQ